MPAISERTPKKKTPRRRPSNFSGAISDFARRHWALLAITGLGAALRGAGLGRRGLWVDEVVTWNLARHLWFDPGASHGVYFYLVHLSMKLFGESEAAIRLPSAVLGVASIPMIYAAGLALWGRREALVAAAAVAVCNWLILFSQESRFYSALFFASALALFALLKLWSTGRLVYFLLVTAAIALLAAIHPTATVFAGICGAWTLAWLVAWPSGRSSAWRWLSWGAEKWNARTMATVAVATAGAMALAYYAYRVGMQYRSVLASLSFSNRTENVDFTVEFFMRHYKAFSLVNVPRGWPWLAAAAVQLAASGAGWYRASRYRIPFTLMLVSLFSVTFVLLFSYETFQPYEVKYSMFFYPPYLLLLSGGVVWLADRTGALAAQSSRERARSGALAVMVLGLLGAGLAAHFPSRGGEFAGFKRAVIEVEKRFAQGDRIVTHDFGRAAVQYHVGRSSIPPGALHLLENDKGDGEIEIGRIVAMARANHELWLVASPNWRLRQKLRSFFETHFEPVATYPSMWGDRFVVELRRWKWAGRTITGAGRDRIEISKPIDARAREPVELSLYVTRAGLYDVTAFADSPVRIEGVEQAAPPTSSRRGETIETQLTLRLPRGVVNLTLAAGAGLRRIEAVPNLSERLVIEAERPSEFAFPSRFSHRKIAGAQAMAYEVNCGAEYEFESPASGLVRLDLVALHDKPGFILYEVSLDRQPVALLLYNDASGEWGRQSVALHAAPGPHRIGIHFVSDAVIGEGDDENLDGFVDRIELSALDAVEAARLDSERPDLSWLLVDPGPELDLSFPPEGVALTGQTRWFASKGSDFRVERPEFAPEQLALRLELPRRSKATALGPAFPVQRGRLVYYDIEIACEQVINHTANASLAFADSAGRLITNRAFYTSKAGLNNTAHWREGINHGFERRFERLVGCQRVPPGATQAVIVAIAYHNTDQPLKKDGRVWFRNPRVFGAEDLMPGGRSGVGR